MFQSTHPRRVWPKQGIVKFTVEGFNPHTHAGCDFQSVAIVPRSSCFNPHTHAGCDYPKNLKSHNINSFNPHTHAGCDSAASSSWGNPPVSIHTPTQGVTEVKRKGIAGMRVSIHTPTQGVTSCTVINAMNQMFQSTHPRRVWLLNRAGDIIDWLFQSTHPRRVWPYHPRHKYSHEGFNPHTHAGCDPAQASQNYQPGGFQSTHPRRVWPCQRRKWLDETRSFNPHTHAGCD